MMKKFMFFVTFLITFLGLFLFMNCERDSPMCPTKPDAPPDTITVKVPGDTIRVEIPGDTVTVEVNKPTISISVPDTTFLGSYTNIKYRTQNTAYVIIWIDGKETQFLNVSGDYEVFFETEGEKVIKGIAYSADNIYSATDYDTTYVVKRVPLDVEPISIPVSLSIDSLASTSVSVNIEVSGHYRITTTVHHDASENQSFYITAVNSEGTIVGPTNPNIGTYKIVVDDGGNGVQEKYSGIFRLLNGINEIQIHHFYKIADLFPGYKNGDNFGLVRISGFWLEFVGEF